MAKVQKTCKCCGKEVTYCPSCTYTETAYSTRDKIQVGAYYNEKKLAWTAYVYTKSYTSRSAEFFDSASLTSLVEVMTKAKEMIAEKIK